MPGRGSARRRKDGERDSQSVRWKSETNRTEKAARGIRDEGPGGLQHVPCEPVTGKAKQEPS